MQINRPFGDLKVLKIKISSCTSKCYLRKQCQVTWTNLDAGTLEALYYIQQNKNLLFFKSIAKEIVLQWHNVVWKLKFLACIQRDVHF